MNKKVEILLIEPFYTGSHQVLIDLLMTELASWSKDDFQITLYKMTGKKWQWRSRTSALYFSQEIPILQENVKSILFASSVLPLNDLLGLRPDLHSRNCRKILYFHENQLVYPIREDSKKGDRDFQYGFNQILSCLSADTVVFNSEFNRTSFLSNICKFFKLQPDYRPKNLRELIEPKTKVLYFPINFEHLEPFRSDSEKDENNHLRILWAHRWEHDKNPQLFFRVVERLFNENIPFRLIVLGESFTDNLEVFNLSRIQFGSIIDNFGFVQSKDEYFKFLSRADIAISTSDHEFFGVSMMEATYLGCYPICPNKLVYPEIFPAQCLYKNEEELYKKLKLILKSPNPRDHLRNLTDSLKINFGLYDWKSLKSSFMSLFNE